MTGDGHPREEGRKRKRLRHYRIWGQWVAAQKLGKVSGMLPANGLLADNAQDATGIPVHVHVPYRPSY